MFGFDENLRNWTEARFDEKTQKIKFSIHTFLNSNAWLALIPIVGYDSINIDYHVRTQSIIIMEKI